MPELKTVEASETAPGVRQFSAIAEAIPARRARTKHPTRTQAAVEWHIAVISAPARDSTNIREMLAEEADQGRFLLVLAAFYGSQRHPVVRDGCRGFLVLSLRLVSRIDNRFHGGRPAACGGARGRSWPEGAASPECSAQLETWRVGTVMLDSPVTTTATGRLERREVSGPGR